ncbi:hypothetical protein [uncultured Corynebacterium sp.]|uniref:hypothetical protein n=1 Tax=uncultured Corynebacterium sp. TaxID=159447 RepID=UPI0025CD664D|nr:hypothetical protein [uncultured Corynebacterium sp.]
MQFSLTRLPAPTLSALRRTVTLDALPAFLEEALSPWARGRGSRERVLAGVIAARIGDAVVEGYPETAAARFGPVPEYAELGGDFPTVLMYSLADDSAVA